MLTPDAIKDKLWNTTFTLQGRIFHNNLLKPAADKEDPSKDPKFSTMFVFPKGSNAKVMSDIQAFLGELKNYQMPNIPVQHLVYPIKDYDTYVRQKGGPNPEYTKGCYWINANSGETIAPYVGKQGHVAGSYMQLSDRDEAETYSGRNAIIQITFYAMTGGKDGRGKWGYGANVKAVLLLEGGERHSGGFNVDPSQAFGNFQVDMGLIQAGGQGPQENFQQPNHFGGQQQQPMGNQPAQQGMGGFGQTNPGQQTNAFPPAGHGQTAQQPASPSNPFGGPQTNAPTQQNPFGGQQQQQQHVPNQNMNGPWNNNGDRKSVV